MLSQCIDKLIQDFAESDCMFVKLRPKKVIFVV